MIILSFKGMMLLAPVVFCITLFELCFKRESEKGQLPARRWARVVFTPKGKNENGHGARKPSWPHARQSKQGRGRGREDRSVNKLVARATACQAGGDNAALPCGAE